MSVIENIQKLFKTKSVQPEDSMDMASVGTPDPLATGAMDEASLQTAAVRQADGNDDAFGSSRMRRLKNRRIRRQRRSPEPARAGPQDHRPASADSGVFPGRFVAVLGTVTFLALSQADKVAQQVAAPASR
jgi:twitching motility protein PilJ